MVFQLTFSFPKRIKRQYEYTRNLKALTNEKSFPVISTNISSQKDMFQFIEAHDPRDKSNKYLQKDTFRSRNHFIIARNILGNVIEKDIRELENVSKISSVVSISIRSFTSLCY